MSKKELLSEMEGGDQEAVAFQSVSVESSVGGACSAIPDSASSHLSTVFVGNLSFLAKPNRVRKFFSKFGKVVNVSIVEDHVKKRSRGIAFVRFENTDGVKNALAASEDERTFDNRILRIFPAKEKRLKKLRDDVEELARKKLASCCVGVDDMDVNNDPSVTPICILNDDIMLTIFSYLPMDELLKLDFVCRKWELLALRSWAVLKTLDFSKSFTYFGKEPLTDEIFKKILTRTAKVVRTINTIGAGALLSYTSVQIIGELCPNLQDLSLTGDEVTDTGITTLATRCKDLKRICLPRCQSITDKGLKTMFLALQDLEHVDLSGNGRLSGKCFSSIGPAVSKLFLNGCHKILPSGFCSISKKCKRLVELDMTQCHELDENSLKQICSHLKELKKFNLTGATIGEEQFHRISQLSKLEELKLSGNVNIPDDDIIRICQGCRELRILDISDCCSITDSGLLFLTGCTKLTHLDLSNVTQITDISLMPLALLGRLESLKISMCCLVSSETCEALFTHCTRLTRLDISGCESITDSISDSLRKAMDNRNNGIPLHISIGGTQAMSVQDTVSNPLLTFDDFFTPEDELYSFVAVDGLFDFDSLDSYSSGEDYRNHYFDDEAYEVDDWF